MKHLLDQLSACGVDPESVEPDATALMGLARFALASRDRFFLCIEARDPRFDRAATAAFLRTLKPSEVSDVEC